MPVLNAAKSLWWLVHKDVLQEVRAHSVWPRMLLLGVVLVFLVATQTVLPQEQKAPVVGGLLWLAIFFAGTLAVERSFTIECDDDCWQSLTLYPLAPSALFFAKLAVNFTSLVAMELVLVPACIVLTDVSILARPGFLVLIAILGNVGFAAVGTIVSSLTAGLRHRSGLLALLLLPLAMPAILGSAEATRMVVAAESDPQCWQWIRLLAVFAGVFTIGGALVFEFVIEE